eukprot:COSAG04_NODE_155_length_22379_cov_5.613707_19_plen_154_part_00
MDECGMTREHEGTSRDLGRHYCHIGFNDHENEGDFVWSNGSPSDYENWQEGEPNDWRGGIDAQYGEDIVEISDEFGHWDGRELRGRWNDNVRKATQDVAAHAVPNPCMGLVLCAAGARYLGGRLRGWFRLRGPDVSRISPGLRSPALVQYQKT